MTTRRTQGRAGMVNRVVQIHGGMGYPRELPIERWYRQVRGYPKIGGHLGA